MLPNFFLNEIWISLLCNDQSVAREPEITSVYYLNVIFLSVLINTTLNMCFHYCFVRYLDCWTSYYKNLHIHLPNVSVSLNISRPKSIMFTKTRLDHSVEKQLIVGILQLELL